MDYGDTATTKARFPLGEKIRREQILSVRANKFA